MPSGRTDAATELRMSGEWEALTPRTAELGQILWDLHYFSLMTERAFELCHDESLTTNNDQVTLTSLYVRGPLRPRDLVSVLDLTRGGVSGLIDRLESVGLLARAEAVDDGRGVQVLLTDDGRRTVERLGLAFSIAFDASEPLLLQVVERARAAGLECGDFRPVGHRSALPAVTNLLTLNETVRPLWDAYRVGFGADEPSPGRVFQTLWLAAQEEASHVLDIADRTGMSPSTLSELLQRLEAQGSVRRRRSTGDGRVVIVRVTASGRSQLKTAITSADAPVGEILRRLLPV